MRDHRSKYTRDRMAELRSQGVREVAIVVGWFLAALAALLVVTMLLR